MEREGGGKEEEKRMGINMPKSRKIRDLEGRGSPRSSAARRLLRAPKAL